MWLWEDSQWERTWKTMLDIEMDCDDAHRDLRDLHTDGGKQDAETMFQRGLECRTTWDRRYWLVKAAEEGHIRAMHELGLTCPNLQERRRWLREAARHGWQPAVVELADMER